MDVQCCGLVVEQNINWVDRCWGFQEKVEKDGVSLLEFMNVGRDGIS